MPLPDVRDRQEGFAGGLNVTSDKAALANNEILEAQNTRLSTRGAAEKRGGTQFITTDPLVASPVVGGTSWARTSSVQEVVVCGGDVFTGALTIPTTFTNRGGSLSTTVYPSFAVFKGPSAEGVYIADGGRLNFWDGTTLTEDIVDTPELQSIVAWGPRLFGFLGDTIYWSDTTNGINGHTLGAVAGGGQAIVRTYGGQELIAGAPLKNSLLLFHRQAISRFTGATTNDINIEAGTSGVSGDVGTVAKRSIIGVENSVYFLTDRGAFLATEIDVQPVSSPLEELLSGLGKLEWAGVSAVHARAENEIRWTIPNVGAYVYNYRTRGWTGPWDTAYTTTTAMWDTVDDEGRSVVLTGRTDGRVLWCDRPSEWEDNVPAAGGAGTQYPFRVTCKRFFGGDYTSYKSWRTMYLLGQFPDPERVVCEMRADGTSVSVPLPYNATAFAAVPEWGDATGMWGAPDTAWGSGAVDAIERARVPLHGTNPWIDVSVNYTGDNSARVSIVDVIGFGRTRR